MSGHSKWATTKHKKAAIDAKRGKLFAKLVKNIEIAARNGGGDPDGNPALYDVITKAKKNSLKNGGSLAENGSVSFNFERKGQIVVPADGVDFDKLFEVAAEAGADDVVEEDDVFTITTAPSDVVAVRKAIQDAGFDYDSAESTLIPLNEVELDFEAASKVNRLIDALDELDDVQDIFANWTASDEVMAQLDEE